MRRVEPGVLVGGGVLGLIGLWAALEAWGYGLWRARAPGEGLYPFIVALSLMGLASASLVQGAFVRTTASLRPGFDDDAGPPQWRKIAIYLAGLAALAGLLPALGYWIVTAAVLVLILRGAEGLSWRLTFAVTAASSLVTYVVFERLLGLPLPRATLF
jgi:putative tricarboxylic transport membrane protein